jgi:hypothetical protein
VGRQCRTTAPRPPRCRSRSPRRRAVRPVGARSQHAPQRRRPQCGPPVGRGRPVSTRSRGETCRAASASADASSEPVDAARAADSTPETSSSTASIWAVAPPYTSASTSSVSVPLPRLRRPARGPPSTDRGAPVGPQTATKRPGSGTLAPSVAAPAARGGPLGRLSPTMDRAPPAPSSTARATRTAGSAATVSAWTTASIPR